MRQILIAAALVIFTSSANAEAILSCRGAGQDTDTQQIAGQSVSSTRTTAVAFDVRLDEPNAKLSARVPNADGVRRIRVAANGYADADTVAFSETEIVATFRSKKGVMDVLSMNVLYGAPKLVISRVTGNFTWGSSTGVCEPATTERKF